MIITDEIISSRQNRSIVEAVKLGDRKERENTELFRFDGIKLFFEAVEKGIFIKKILVSESRKDVVLGDMKSSHALKDTAVYVVKDELFSRISEEHSPEGIICVAEFPKHHVRLAGKEHVDCIDGVSRVILLDSVRDPGNMGSIMRSAAAFGIDTVIVSRDCADIYNPKTVRGAMGALFKLKILMVEDIVEAVSCLRANRRRVFAAALDREAERLDNVKLEKSDCVIIGNEGHGLDSAVICASNGSLYIPMEAGSESLNAAVAASVILWSMYSN